MGEGGKEGKERRAAGGEMHPAFLPSFEP